MSFNGLSGFNIVLGCGKNVSTVDSKLFSIAELVSLSKTF
jgi:hypothetical protein